MFQRVLAANPGVIEGRSGMTTAFFKGAYVGLHVCFVKNILLPVGHDGAANAVSGKEMRFRLQ